MITGFILSIPAYLLMVVFSLLPQGQPASPEWVSSVYLIWGYVNSFSFIVPVSTLVFCLGIAMVFHGSILAFRAMHWIITKIPFVG